MSNLSGWLSVAVSIVALGIAGWSAYMSSANRRVAQGNAVSRLLAEYASPEMAKAIRVVSTARTSIEAYLGMGPVREKEAFRRAVGADLIKAFGSTVPNSSGASIRESMRLLSDAGRRLHWFVKQADILRRNSVISDDLFRDAISGTNGYRLWAEVWLPYIKMAPQDGQPAAHFGWTIPMLRRFPPVGESD